MPDPLQRLVLSRTLWLMVAPPLVGFAWHLAAYLRVATLPRRTRAPWSRRVGVGSVLLASAAMLGHVVRLARAPGGERALLQHLGSSIRVGPLVTGFDLLLDPLSAAACALACAVAIAGAMLLASRPGGPRSWKAWAWLELALGAGLLSFLAGGFVTMLLGWGLAAAAGAWLAGWSDPRAGAVRATRGAVAIMALLFGAMLLARELDAERYADPAAVEHGLGATARRVVSEAGSPGPAAPGPALTFPELGASFAGSSTNEAAGAGGVAFALVAFLVAVLAMSASTPPAGAPLGLAAVASGATTSALGPFLLLRLAFLVPLVPRGAAMITGAGALMIVMAGHRALVAPKGPRGPLRWIALVCGAPAGLTCVSLGMDGPDGARLVLVASGLVAALLAMTAVRRGFSSNDCASRRASAGDAWLGEGTERAGALLMTFEHGVVDALAGAAGVLVHASGWALDRFDVLVLALPADVMATRAVRIARRVEPIIGGSLARIAWTIVAIGVLGAIAHAFWPVR